MPTAGYSGKPLVAKLGVRSGQRVLWVRAPPGFARALGPLPVGVAVSTRASGTYDLIHLFVRDEEDLEAVLPRLQRRLRTDGMLWISWPKLSSPLARGLRESKVRDAGLRAGLVDIKVVAVDADWSGLKFVRRLSARR